MRILIACECSGVVREAFRAKGHDAWSCDILPAADGSEFHIQSDVLELIDQPLKMLRHSFQRMISHPPCDFLTNSAAWAFADPDFERYPGVGYHQRVKPGTLTGAARREARMLAIEFAEKLFFCGIEQVCLENPIGSLSGILGEATQIIQPHQFGEDASKSTCLWLKGLPPLRPTQDYPPRIVEHNGKQVRRWSNQTDSGQNRLSPSDDRASVRAVTYQGIAKAMADQWT